MKITLMVDIHELIIVNLTYIGRTQLLFATGIECGIHERQVLKYQSSVTSISIVMFHHLIPLIIIEY